MNADVGDKIISNIPLGKVLKLVLDLIKLSKGGLTKEEGVILLEDLLLITADVAQKVGKE